MPYYGFVGVRKCGRLGKSFILIKANLRMYLLFELASGQVYVMQGMDQPYKFTALFHDDTIRYVVFKMGHHGNLFQCMKTLISHANLHAIAARNFEFASNFPWSILRGLGLYTVYYFLSRYSLSVANFLIVYYCIERHDLPQLYRQKRRRSIIVYRERWKCIWNERFWGWIPRRLDMSCHYTRWGRI